MEVKSYIELQQIAVKVVNVLANERISINQAELVLDQVKAIMNSEIYVTKIE